MDERVRRVTKAEAAREMEDAHRERAAHKATNNVLIAARVTAFVLWALLIGIVLLWRFVPR